MRSRLLRMAYNLTTSASALDPAVIKTIYQYELIRNLFGRLVEYDRKGNLVAGIPDSFSWRDNSVTFVFGNKVTTIDGARVSARDAELSLKRLIIQGKSGHGDIRRFLCPEYKLQAIDDACPGISVTENRLTLTVAKQSYLPLLLATLESADYSIIPESSFSNVEGILTISDYRNTSGPYYVESDSERGALKISANKRHYRYSEKMPQEIQIVPVGYLDGLSSFLKGEVDFLPTPQAFDGDEARAILGNSENEVHETLPLKVTLVRFSPKAIQEFSPRQRLYAANAAGRAISRILPQFGAQPTSQFFQALSDGALNDNQLEHIKKIQNAKDRPTFSRPIELSLFSKFVEPFSIELKAYPEIKVISSKAPVLSLKPEERPDMYFVTNDSAWTEDMALLGHNFEEGTFDLPGLNKEEWFQDYLSTEDKKERIRRLNKLHFDLLDQAAFIPVEVAPYYAAVRKPWHLDQSNLSAGIEIWRMRLE